MTRVFDVLVIGTWTSGYTLAIASREAKPFTFPPLAGVGMTEPQAINSGMRFHINRGTMTGWASSRRIGQKMESILTVLAN